MSSDWIEIKPGCELPNNFEWVEGWHSLIAAPLEIFWWDKYGWGSECITHWRRLSWHFDPIPVQERQVLLESE